MAVDDPLTRQRREKQKKDELLKQGGGKEEVEGATAGLLTHRPHSIAFTSSTAPKDT